MGNDYRAAHIDIDCICVLCPHASQVPESLRPRWVAGVAMPLTWMVPSLRWSPRYSLEGVHQCQCQCQCPSQCPFAFFLLKRKASSIGHRAAIVHSDMARGPPFPAARVCSQLDHIPCARAVDLKLLGLQTLCSLQSTQPILSIDEDQPSQGSRSRWSGRKSANLHL